MHVLVNWIRSLAAGVLLLVIILLWIASTKHAAATISWCHRTRYWTVYKSKAARPRHTHLDSVKPVSASKTANWLSAATATSARLRAPAGRPLVRAAKPSCRSLQQHRVLWLLPLFQEAQGWAYALGFCTA